MTWNECLLSKLPFFKTKDLDASFNTKIYDHPPATTSHLKKINENRNNTSIAHLNVQALMSTSNEFSLMLDEYQFDVVALSKSCLKDYIYQQNYVQINGYNAIFKNGTNKRGGGVGFYIKNQYEYKIRKDLTSMHESLEVLLIEIRVRNRNSPTLICVTYQTSSAEAEKLEWLEKFEALMTDIYTSWNGILILTGDFNIDLLNSCKESTKRCSSHVFVTTTRDKTNQERQNS